LKKSLKYNEFELHYQPKVNVKTASVFGVEALLRWNHPEKGLLYPDSFLPQVAGLPLESKIGQWVIQKAVQQLAEWNAAGLSLEVSVNISSHHLQSPYFIEELERICKMYPTVDPANLQLEILESSALGEHKIVSNIIQQCEDRLGVRVSLDDFGTGYSSLTHLRNLPVQTIKIDRSFVIDLLDDPNDFSIIEGVVSLSNAFKRELIAEGVESEQHGLMLLTMGCHQLQGYTIAKPLPASEVENWLATYQIPSSWLDYVKRNHSIIEKQLVQFTIISESWINLLSTMVFDDVSIDENWPILSPKQCHHHTWLKQAISQFNLNNEDIAQLKALHVALHNIANDLFMLCENHQRYEAQQQLTKAQQLNQQLNDAVKQVLTKQQADKPLLIIN
jgi:EAL domain-containing protein (putative c-di-GMP-specific phosphodiesterase class I)